MSETNPYVNFEGTIGVRVDARSERVQVQLSGGPLHTPVQMSAKADSQTERLLFDALTATQVRQLRGGNYRLNDEFVNLYAAQYRGNAAEFIITHDPSTSQIRLVVDSDNRVIEFLAPRAEIALQLLIHRIPALADFEVRAPGPEVFFKRTTFLEKGDKITIKGQSGVVKTVQKPKRGSGENIPHKVEIVTDKVTFNLQGGHEMVEVERDVASGAMSAQHRQSKPVIALARRDLVVLEGEIYEVTDTGLRGSAVAIRNRNDGALRGISPASTGQVLVISAVLAQLATQTGIPISNDSLAIAERILQAGWRQH